MTTLTKIIAETAFVLVLALSATSAAHAADRLAMKPLQAISFDVESKHAVGYFLAEADTCNLALTVAEAPDWNQGPRANLIATRFEAAIEAGKTAQFAIASGKIVEFDCQVGAQAMNMRLLAQVASSPPAK